ncbi:MAG: DUF2807 domain-containing protein [Muribaculaceae bacterium]|nr:DUF2807 domain-containing protein [Muribaculaceae bacterium]
MRNYFITLVALCIGLFTLKAETNDYKLEILDFTELQVTNNINVDYICSPDSAGYAYFSCTPEMASKLMFSNNKGNLRIQLDTDGTDSIGVPTVRVYSSSLTKAENASDSTMRILSNVPVQNFRARVVGNGLLLVNNVEANSLEANVATGRGRVVILGGQARQAKLSSIGTGPVEAGRLQARKVKTILFGTGDIDCTALESLTVYGAGSGKVFYAGEPEKIVNRGLGIKVFPVSNNPVK